MPLENLVMQARDPITTGLFWEAALGLITDHADVNDYEGRLELGEGLFLDVCIERVATPPSPTRLHADLLGPAGRLNERVERLISLGAYHLDIGQHEVQCAVLTDPDGNPFCVLEEPEPQRDTGPISALQLQSRDPEREGALYAALTGWMPAVGTAPVTLRHPSQRGPLLELRPERAPKHGQNRLHLDVRPDAAGADQAGLVELALSVGATLADEEWAQGHSWTVMRDLSGNEFCILQDL